jgi:hypothetical protein
LKPEEDMKLIESRRKKEEKGLRGQHKKMLGE